MFSTPRNTKASLHYNAHHCQGVTLVELSISVAVIGLLLIMITAGTALLHHAGLRRTITEFTSLKQSISEFKGKYAALPGDLPNASDYFGTYAASTPPSGAENGNGNGVIDGDEDLYAWRHLNLAGLYPGRFTGTAATSDIRFSIDVNAPSSEHYTTGLFRFYAITFPLYDTRGHAIQLGTPNAAGLPNAGIAKPKDAYAIDSKLDDGIASTGMFISTNGNSTCVDEEHNYALDSKDADCNLIAWYEIF